MRQIKIGECEITILPIVKGLISETDKIREAFNDSYDAYAIALGMEEVEALKERENLPQVFEPVDLDLVYTEKLSAFGDIGMPDPAFSEFVDLCKENSKYIFPLDMNDTIFSNVYCEKVNTFDFIKERSLAKKAYRAKITSTDPTSFAMEWDAIVNKIKGYAQISKEREKYMAEQLKITAKYKKSIFAVIEVERVDGILSYLEN